MYKKSEIKDILAQAEFLHINTSIQKYLLMSQIAHGKQHQGICLNASKLNAVKYEYVKYTLFHHDQRVYFSYLYWLIVPAVTARYRYKQIPRVNDLLQKLVILDSIQVSKNMIAETEYLATRSLNMVEYSAKNNEIFHHSCRLSPAVSKASAGAMEIANIFAVDSLAAFITELSSDEWLICGTSADDNLDKTKMIDMNMCQVINNKNIAVIFGNEGSGLSEEVEKLCHVFLKVDNHGSNYIQCLNVSVATGVILHALSKVLQQ
ncbi:hypothetical protein HELRODRAFT_158402 [Helobdella robusta]|uniref:tRNA/rRNA methyltransferase SpoU type domain-containing protein n=1 Tax=Helobdella robusta TaxID=6412 RepID=T1EMR6_HELRO|nr:hypothetical protein HELRODRAFT_158402 [Helobdella robusta]ESO12015.1 hypothetical protein HELRODRAFT_158402 [Helobdella robusta]